MIVQKYKIAALKILIAIGIVVTLTAQVPPGGIPLDESTCQAYLGGSWDSGTNTCTITSTATVLQNDQIRIPGNVTLVITADGALIINGAITNQGIINNHSSITINPNGGILNDDNGTINNHGPFVISVSALGLVSHGTFNNHHTLLSIGTIENLGTIDNKSTGTIENQVDLGGGKGTINNSGVSGVISSAGAIENYGIFNNNPGNIGSGVFVTGIFTNYDTLNNGDDFSATNFTNYGTIVNSLAIGVEGNFTNFGTVSNTRTVVVNGTGTLTNHGIFENHATLALVHENSVLINEVDGTLTNEDDGIILNSGTLTNHGTLTNKTGGSLTISVDGTLINEDGATITSSGVFEHRGHLQNCGTFTQESDTYTQYYGATYDNCDGAGIFLLETSATYINFGTLDVDGTFNIYGTFTNEGSGLVINHGNVFVYSSLTFNNHGNYINEDDGTTNITGTFNNEDDSILTNHGTLNILVDGILTNDGAFINNNIVTIDGTFNNDCDGAISGSVDGVNEVCPPQDLLDRLADDVRALGLGENSEKQLLKKIDDTRDKLDEGKSEAAIEKLTGFIDQVNDKVAEGEIDQETANALIAAAQRVIDTISG